MTQRIESLASGLNEMELEGILITDEINVRYLTGFTGDSSYLYVTPEKSTILSDGRYQTQIADECPGLEAIIRTPRQKMIQSVETAVGDSGATRVGLEADHVSVSLMQTLTRECDQVDWQPTTNAVESLRMIKDQQEIEILKQSVVINEQAFSEVVPRIRPDWTERQLAFELEAAIRRLGAEGFSFEPIVGAGPSGALPHYRPGNAVVGEHKTLLIDWGTCLNGYASDLTRTLHLAEPSSEFRKAYEAVLNSQLAAIEKMGPGVVASEVDQAARDVLRQASLDEYFIHGLGHGVGLQIHESPRMSAISTETLESGMVITVEPGVYFEGEFGIRIEDDVLITDSGCEVLSQLPKGLDDCRLML